MALSFAALVFLIIILIWLGISVFAGTPNQGEIIRGRLEAIEKGAGIRQECARPEPDSRRTSERHSHAQQDAGALVVARAVAQLHRSGGSRDQTGKTRLVQRRDRRWRLWK